MPNTVTVIECHYSWPRTTKDLQPLLDKGGDVYVIEPFAAYHHTGKIRFFPTLLPPCIEELLAQGRLQLLPASSLRTDDIMTLSWKDAMDALDPAYGVFKKQNGRILTRLTNCLGGDAEKAFRQTLVDKLGIFYSVRGLLLRLEELFPSAAINFYSACSPFFFHRIQKLLRHAGLDLPHLKHTTICSATPIREVLVRWRDHFLALGYMAAQGVRCLWPFWPEARIPKGGYSIAMNLNAPNRQLLNRQMGADFLVDGKEIRREDMLYVLPGQPLRPGAGSGLSREQEKRLQEIGGTVLHAPSAWGFASPPGFWLSLLLHGLLSRPDHGLTLRPAATVSTHYYRWKRLAKRLRLKHFVAYADFGPAHVGRNMALQQAGTRTWYVQDSNNHSLIFQESPSSPPPLHPFWKDLHFSDMACWCEGTADYFRSHGFAGTSHVIGCLRSSYLEEKVATQQSNEVLFRIDRGAFIVAAFDSTYTVHTQTTYEMGIAFARDLLRMADEEDDVLILFKEKKGREIHARCHPLLGPELVAVYERMANHPRIRMCSHATDAATVISGADLTISFPFTSTTFEALAVNRPGIWHDPLKGFCNTLYATFPGLVVHGYEDLLATVRSYQKDRDKPFVSPFPDGSRYMDPFRDGKALDRLRSLLKRSPNQNN